jgi:hypothetical protein
MAADLPHPHQPLTAETFAVLAARTADDGTAAVVVAVLDGRGRSDGALFVGLPADPAGRGRIVDVLRDAAPRRLDGNAGYLAYAIVEDTDGQRTAFAVIEPIAAGPGNDPRP